MIRDVEYWRKWEREWEKAQPINYLQNLKVFESLYREAVLLGIIPPKDPLEGLEQKIKMARILNVRRFT